MFKLLHQCSIIVAKTQLTNNQMPEFHCHCECSKCPPPVPSSNTSLQSLTLISLSQPCRLVLVAAWQVAPDNLKCFLDFGDCFRLCFKLAVSFQHCTRHAIVHWVYIQQIWRPLVLCDEIWRDGLQPIPCAARCVCWRAILLEDEPGGQPAVNLKER